MQIICKYSILNRQNITSFDYAVEPLISDPHGGLGQNTETVKQSEEKKNPFGNSTTSVLVEKHAYKTNTPNKYISRKL